MTEAPTCEICGSPVTQNEHGEVWHIARPMTVAEAAKLVLAENVERGLSKSMAHFISVKEWEGYKRGVQAYTERLRALSEGGE